MEYLTTADQLAKLGREKAERARYMAKLVDRFKDFVTDSIYEEHDLEFDDHFEFLKAALETFSQFDDADGTNAST